MTWKYAMQTDASSPHVGPRNLPDALQPADGNRLSPHAIQPPGSEPIEPPHVGPTVSSSYGFVVMKTEAATALAQMGFTKQEARAAVEEAAKDLPRDASLERLMRAALRLTKR